MTKTKLLYLYYRQIMKSIGHYQMMKQFFVVCMIDKKTYSSPLINLNHSGIPMGRPFFNQVRLGGGIPVASQEKVTGLPMVSTTLSCTGPSILGGTEERGTEISL